MGWVWRKDTAACKWTQLREHTFLILLLAPLLKLVLLHVVALGHFLAAVRLGVLVGQHLPGQHRQLLQMHFTVSTGMRLHQYLVSYVYQAYQASV